MRNLAIRDRIAPGQYQNQICIGASAGLLFYPEPERRSGPAICKPYGIPEGIACHAEYHPFSLYVPYPVHPEPAAAECGLEKGERALGLYAPVYPYLYPLIAGYQRLALPSVPLSLNINRKMLVIMLRSL